MTRLATDPLMLMVPAHHQLASRSRIEITRLRNEVFISGTADDPNRVALASACARAGFTPQVAFETADYAATASMVRHGFAVAVVPRLAWPAGTHGVARLSLRGRTAASWRGTSRWHSEPAEPGPDHRATPPPDPVLASSALKAACKTEPE